jgi:predicted N-acyltransferase
MATEIFESIDQIDSSEWNQLVRDRSFAGWHSLRVAEAVISKHQARYITLRHHGTLQAAAVCSIQDRFHSRFLQWSMGWIPRHFPYLRCDLPIYPGSGLFFSNEEQLDVVFPKLLMGMMSILRQERALFHSFDHLLPIDPIWIFLQNHNYHRFDHLSEAYLDIGWTSFEDYLKDLTQKENETFAHTQEQLKHRGITIEITDPLCEDVNALQQLVIHLSYREQKPYIYANDLFIRASTMMGKDFKLIIARQSGRAIGCIALLHDTNEWIVRWPGLDLECESNAEVYYGLLAECIRQAIIANGQRLYLGVIDFRTIQHFGITIEKRMGAAAVRSRPLHWLAGRMLGLTANPEARQTSKNS